MSESVVADPKECLRIVAWSGDKVGVSAFVRSKADFCAVRVSTYTFRR